MTTDIAVNPPAREIGRMNLIYAGTAREHFLAPMRGSVSIKTVLRGTGTWHAEGRSFHVRERAWLLLGDGQEYSLSIESAKPVTTFCLFFRHGFVEEALRAATSSDTRLLDRPFDDQPAELSTALRPQSARMQSLLVAMQAHPTEEQFAQTAVLIAQEIAEQRTAAIPAIKASTREELRRRVQRGTDHLLSHLHGNVRIEDAASAACLSLFHFHRAFTAIHGTTPYQFLTRERLALAAHLLQHGTQEVTEIAAAIGFESPTSFATRFSKAFGTSPAAYRRAAKSR